MTSNELPPMRRTRLTISQAKQDMPKFNYEDGDFKIKSLEHVKAFDYYVKAPLFMYPTQINNLSDRKKREKQLKKLRLKLKTGFVGCKQQSGSDMCVSYDESKKSGLYIDEEDHVYSIVDGHCKEGMPTTDERKKMKLKEYCKSFLTLKSDNMYRQSLPIERNDEILLNNGVSIIILDVKTTKRYRGDKILVQPRPYGEAYDPPDLRVARVMKDDIKVEEREELERVAEEVTTSPDQGSKKRRNVSFGKVEEMLSKYELSRIILVTDYGGTTRRGSMNPRFSVVKEIDEVNTLASISVGVKSDNGESYEVKEITAMNDVILIGTSDVCDLIVKGDDLKVHARIYFRDGKLIVNNGDTDDGIKIALVRPIRVQKGDTLNFGNLEMSIETEPYDALDSLALSVTAIRKNRHGAWHPSYSNTFDSVFRSIGQVGAYTIGRGTNNAMLSIKDYLLNQVQAKLEFNPSSLKFEFIPFVQGKGKGVYKLIGKQLGPEEEGSILSEMNQMIKLKKGNIFKVGATEFLVRRFRVEKKEEIKSRLKQNTRIVNMLLKVPAFRVLNSKQLHNVVRFGTLTELTIDETRDMISLTELDVECFIIVESGLIEFEGKIYKEGEFFGEKNLFSKSWIDSRSNSVEETKIEMNHVKATSDKTKVFTLNNVHLIAALGPMLDMYSTSVAKVAVLDEQTNILRELTNPDKKFINTTGYLISRDKFSPPPSVDMEHEEEEEEEEEESEGNKEENELSAYEEKNEEEAVTGEEKKGEAKETTSTTSEEKGESDGNTSDDDDADGKPSHYITLHAVCGPIRGYKVRLNGTVSTIGCLDSGCTIEIGDKLVSPRHAALIYHEGDYYLQDMKSISGTYLKLVKGVLVDVDYGDTYIMGATELKIFAHAQRKYVLGCLPAERCSLL